MLADKNSKNAYYHNEYYKNSRLWHD